MQIKIQDFSSPPIFHCFRKDVFLVYRLYVYFSTFRKRIISWRWTQMMKSIHEDMNTRRTEIAEMNTFTVHSVKKQNTQKKK